MRKRNAVLLAALAGSAAGLSSCSSSHHSATGATTTTPSASSTSAPSAATSTGPPPTSTVSTTAPVATAPPSTAPAAPANCASGALVASLAGANGTAGSVYYTLLLTNRGTTRCVMQGYPGVSFVTGSSGQQVGAPAARTPGSAPEFDLAPAASAHAVLQITDAANYGSGCGVTATDGLRVYPPNQTAALFVAHADQGCSNPTDVTLHVGPMQPPA